LIGGGDFMLAHGLGRCLRSGDIFRPSKSGLDR
jgi:hypothetical protein